MYILLCNAFKNDILPIQNKIIRFLFPTKDQILNSLDLIFTNSYFIK